MCQQCLKELRKKNPADPVLSAVAIALGNIKCPAMRALEDLTPSGSEYVNDPEFCLKYIKDKLAWLHNKTIEQQKKINGLDGIIKSKDEEIRLLNVECFHNQHDAQLELIGRTCKHCGKQYVGTAAGMCSNCGKFQ